MGKKKRGQKRSGFDSGKVKENDGGDGALTQRAGSSQGVTEILGDSPTQGTSPLKEDEYMGGNGEEGRREDTNGVRRRDRGRGRRSAGRGQGRPCCGKGDGGIHQGELQESSCGRGSSLGSTHDDFPPMPGGLLTSSKSPSQSQEQETMNVSPEISQERPAKPLQQPTVQTPSQQQSSETAPSKDLTTMLSAIEKLGLKHRSAGLNPPKRKHTGSLGRNFEVETNHLPFSIKVKEIIHYDVVIEPDKPKKLMRLVMETFRQKYFPRRFPAFDGKKNLYSSGPLDFGQSYCNNVNVRDSERQMDLEFKVTIKYAARIDTTTLVTDMESGTFIAIPQKAIQAVDVVLRSLPALRFIPVGRSFFTPPRSQPIRLGDGIELWNGFFQSAIIGWKPFINVDVAHKGFPKSQGCLDVIFELCRRVDNLQYRDLNKVEKYLKGLKVNYEIPGVPNTKRIFRVNSLRSPANKESFTYEGKKMTVEKYYQQVKGYTLKYPNLPCLHLGSPQRSMYMPIELCSVAPGQVVMRKLTERQVKNMGRAAAVSPDKRKDKIMNSLRQVDYGSNPVLKEFEIDIGSSFEKVPARMLDPPVLSIPGAVNMGVWKMGQFADAKHLKDWVILNLDSNIKENKIVDFGREMVKNGASLGMKISQPRLESADVFKRNWTEKFNPESCGEPDLVVVIVPEKPKYIYERVKQTAELTYGILTQCIKSNTLIEMKPATVSNILLKVNTKLNGMNHFITKRLNCLVTPCMIVGADVTHPSRDSINIPSVAAVAASFDVHAFKYAIEYRLQPQTEEIIEDLQSIMENHLRNFYRKNNQAKPLKIIMFRDGVSDGQFSKVLNKELLAIRRACSSLEANYQPKITFLVVQKRHHTRFFPPKEFTDGRTGNVPAGTIVDTHITHPAELDFYLASHAGIQGTSRPTKYHLLWDDSDLSTDELQALTYHLCHMFSRCTRSVSYPAPTYYAHLAASRGKTYIGDQGIDLRNLKHEQERREISDLITKNWPMFFV